VKSTNYKEARSTKYKQAVVQKKHKVPSTNKYEGWNFNNGNYLFTTDTK